MVNEAIHTLAKELGLRMGGKEVLSGYCVGLEYMLPGRQILVLWDIQHCPMLTSAFAMRLLTKTADTTKQDTALRAMRPSPPPPA